MGHARREPYRPEWSKRDRGNLSTIYHPGDAMSYGVWRDREAPQVRRRWPRIGDLFEREDGSTVEVTRVSMDTVSVRHTPDQAAKGSTVYTHDEFDVLIKGCKLTREGT